MLIPTQKSIKNQAKNQAKSLQTYLKKQLLTKQEHSKNNSLFYRTIHTNYHYSANDCHQLFRVRFQNDESRFNIDQSEQIIQKRLRSLLNFGYSVERTLKRPKIRYDYDPLTNKKIKNFKTMRRKVKLSFKCSNCSKNFTSIVGLFQIKFNVKVINKKHAEVYFDCKIYKMKCERCRKFCVGKIYESQLRAATKSFYLIIAQITEGVEPPTHYDGRQKMHQQFHDHKEQFCEACIKGVCFARQKGENKIKESKKQVEDQTNLEE